MSCPQGCDDGPIPDDQNFETTIATSDPDSITVTVGESDVPASIDHLGGTKYRIIVDSTHLTAPGPLKIADSSGCLECHEITS